MKKLVIAGILHTLALTSILSQSNADERIRPANVLLREGYRPVFYPRFAGYPLNQRAYNSPTRSVLPHSLSWPVAFRDANRSVGNSMTQFQPFFNPPYFHAGCDLVMRLNTEVRTPVSGRIEGGHYSYSTHPDGSMTKFFIPWPGTGDSNFFEIAVITEDGNRYEFHHINRDKLPTEIINQLNKGNMGRINKGTVVGYPVDAFESRQYTHIHYNVVQPDGIHVNPEWISELVPDNTAPEILFAYAAIGSGAVIPFEKGSFLEPPAKSSSQLRTGSIKASSRTHLFSLPLKANRVRARFGISARISRLRMDNSQAFPQFSYST